MMIITPLFRDKMNIFSTELGVQVSGGTKKMNGFLFRSGLERKISLTHTTAQISSELVGQVCFRCHVQRKVALVFFTSLQQNRKTKRHTSSKLKPEPTICAFDSIECGTSITYNSF